MGKGKSHAQDLAVHLGRHGQHDLGESEIPVRDRLQESGQEMVRVSNEQRLCSWRRERREEANQGF